MLGSLVACERSVRQPALTEALRAASVTAEGNATGGKLRSLPGHLTVCRVSNVFAILGDEPSGTDLEEVAPPSESGLSTLETSCKAETGAIGALDRRAR
jgi:hypothetical protein